jgi:23S rRNA pseudouridine1911/1915/1917 synthase
VRQVKTTRGRNHRLDQYVVAVMPESSRAFATRLIEQGKVLVNDTPQLKPGYKLRAADQVRIDYVPEDQVKPADITLEVLYEDNDCVVINKPVGLLTHSKGAFNPEPTVASWLSSRFSGVSGERAGIVHRLDRATSGVMICAKTPEALSWLQKQFSTRKVKKTYIAIVEGSLALPEAIIDMPIERNPKKPQTFRVGSNGKPAVTAYKVLQTSTERSLIELRPTTGRTHQLRVHLAHIKHPIVGDTFYRGVTADRLLLHALSLEITLPNRQRKIFTAPLPAEFKV